MMVQRLHNLDASETMGNFDVAAHVQMKAFVTRFEIEEADNERTLGPRKLGISEYLEKRVP